MPLTKVVKLTARFCHKALAVSLLLSSAMCAQKTPSGQALYQSHCAMCHEKPNHAPFMNRHVLKTMAPENIVRALASGPMRSQGDILAPAERVSVAEFLTGKRIEQLPPAGVNLCTSQAAKKFSGPSWNGWG